MKESKLAHSNDLVTDAIEKQTRAHAARLEKELYGAWRCGYRYLIHRYQIGDDFRMLNEYTPTDTIYKVRSHNTTVYDLTRISQTDIQGLDISHILTDK